MIISNQDFAEYLDLQNAPVVELATGILNPLAAMFELNYCLLHPTGPSQ